MKCTIRFENKAHGRTRPNLLSAAAAETRIKVQSLEEMAGMVSRRGQRQRRGQELATTRRPLSQKTLEKRPSVLKERSAEENFVMADSYSVLTFGPFYNFHLEVSRLLDGCFTQCLPCDDVKSHPRGPARKRRELSSLRISPLRTCSGILPQVEQNRALPRFHVNFVKKEKTAQLNGLCTGDDLRGILEGKKHYAVDMVFSSLASCIERNLEYEATYNLTQMSMQYTDIVREVLVDHREVQ